MDGEPIRQFAIFAENKVGRLNELVGMLARHRIQPLAISTQDTTDSTIIRMVVDDPDQAGLLFHENGYSFTVSELVVPEIDELDGFRHVLAALMGAEINIHYIYPFIYRPKGKCAFAIHLEDNDLAATVLRDGRIRVLRQNDLSR